MRGSRPEPSTAPTLPHAAVLQGAPRTPLRALLRGRGLRERGRGLSYRRSGGPLGWRQAAERTARRWREGAGSRERGASSPAVADSKDDSGAEPPDARSWSTQTARRARPASRQKSPAWQSYFVRATDPASLAGHRHRPAATRLHPPVCHPESLREIREGSNRLLIARIQGAPHGNGGNHELLVAISVSAPTASAMAGLALSPRGRLLVPSEVRC